MEKISNFHRDGIIKTAKFLNAPQLFVTAVESMELSVPASETVPGDTLATRVCLGASEKTSLPESQYPQDNSSNQSASIPLTEIVQKDMQLPPQPESRRKSLDTPSSGPFSRPTSGRVQKSAGKPSKVLAQLAPQQVGAPKKLYQHKHTFYQGLAPQINAQLRGIIADLSHWFTHIWNHFAPQAALASQSLTIAQLLGVFKKMATEYQKRMVTILNNKQNDKFFFLSNNSKLTTLVKYYQGRIL